MYVAKYSTFSVQKFYWRWSFSIGIIGNPDFLRHCHILAGFPHKNEKISIDKLRVFVFDCNLKRLSKNCYKTALSPENSNYS